MTKGPVQLQTKRIIPRNFYGASFTILYAFALLQFVRYYSKTTDFYLHLRSYLAGGERLPFQERILPILFLKPFYTWPWLMQHFAHAQGAFTLERGPFYLLSLISLSVAAVYAQRLYAAVTKRNLLSFVVFPAFLFTVIWTYSIHNEANFSYPYDFPSLAFFTAGLFYIYRRKFLPVFFIILVGTFNRETTLFLIGIYAIDASSLPERAADRNRFDLKLLPWRRIALLCVTWLAIKTGMAHVFSANDRSEDFLRISYNLHRLTLRLLPAMLNICGYTLPLILLFRSRIVPVRFRNYLWILPMWLGIMFCSGVLVETRIYGELCSYCAVATVLIMEEVIYQNSRQGARRISIADAESFEIHNIPVEAFPQETVVHASEHKVAS